MKRFTFVLAALLAGGLAQAQDNPLPGTSLYHQRATLVDQRGHTFQWQDLRGRVQVVTMFYGHCHLMCPLILENVKSLWKQLPDHERAQLGVLAISLDPGRDTPQSLAKLALDYRTPEAWRMVAPQPNDLRPLASVLNIQYRTRNDGSINHESVLVLLDAQGRELARTDVQGAVPDPIFLSHVRRALATSQHPNGETP